jgi:hypothetical protein
MIRFTPLRHADIVSLDAKTYEHITHLMRTFDPMLYGVGFPHASTYGMAEAREQTRINLERALRQAFTNYGLNWTNWAVTYAPDPWDEVNGYWSSWAITLTPIQ